jgi:FKBP-type peptidyl-prolyl cis-trans isomerase
MKTNTQNNRWKRFFSSAIALVFLGGSALQAAEAPKAATCKKEKDVKKLIKTDLKKGRGKVAKAGSKVTVHYTGCLTNGTKFDSSLDHGSPFSFNLGQGQVIKGWDTGVEGMKVGGKRKLIIPADMGYGASGAGGVIPPNATLVFEVELLDVTNN